MNWKEAHGILESGGCVRRDIKNSDYLFMEDGVLYRGDTSDAFYAEECSLDDIERFHYCNDWVDMDEEIDEP